MGTDRAENIITMLKIAIKELGANINKSICDLHITMNFIHEDLMELKGKMIHTEVRVDKAEEKIPTLESKVLELSRYKPKWNLRLQVLPEEEGENVRRKVIEICQNMDPDHHEKFQEILDSVHRSGR